MRVVQVMEHAVAVEPVPIRSGEATLPAELTVAQKWQLRFVNGLPGFRAAPFLPAPAPVGARRW